MPELLEFAVRATSMWPEGEVTAEQWAAVEQVKLDEAEILDWDELFRGLARLPRLKMLGLSQTGFNTLNRSGFDDVAILVLGEKWNHRFDAAGGPAGFETGVAVRNPVAAEEVARLKPPCRGALCLSNGLGFGNPRFRVRLNPNRAANLLNLNNAGNLP